MSGALRTLSRRFFRTLRSGAPAIAVALATLSAASTTSHAATWNVPADAATIQGGLALAATGDTVEVEPGTYVGPGNRELDFAGKGIVLRSVAGASATILDCQTGGRGFAFDDGEGPSAVVEGFTITNGRVARGGAILCISASPTIRECVLIANRADETGGGVSCQFGATPRLERCRIEANAAFLSGGGMSIIDAGAVILDGVVIGNTAGILGGGIYNRNASPTITETLIADNRSSGAGGGLVIYHLSAPVVTGCTITGNRAAGSAGAAFCDDFAAPTFVDCVVTGNHAEFSGGGVLCTSRSAAILRGTTVAGNRGLQGGGGLCAEASSKFTLERTILWGNCASTGPEAQLVDAGSQLSFTCSLVDSSEVDGPGTTTYGADNLFVDPLFCVPLDCALTPSSGGDHRVAAGSPTLPAASPCGARIGAPGQDCSVIAVPEEPSLRSGRGLSFAPSPFFDRTRIEFGSLGIGTLRLTVVDLAGRLVRSERMEGSSETATSFVWDGRDRAGRAVPPGLYFVRISNGESAQTGRVQRLPAP